MKVVFVCTGNICRSPFGERYADVVSARAGRAHSFSSVGIGALVGAPMEDLMAGELATRGGSAEGFQARQLHYDAVADADLVLALESHHRRVLIEEYPQLHKKTFVLGTAARAVDEALPDEDKIAFILRRRPQRRPGDSIGDPYRRGPAAAQKAAAEIQLAVDKIFG